MQNRLRLHTTDLQADAGWIVDRRQQRRKRNLARSQQAGKVDSVVTTLVEATRSEVHLDHRP